MVKPFDGLVGEMTEAVVDSAEERAPVRRFERDGRERSAKLRVLLAVEAPVESQMLERTLEQHGHVLVSVMNGSDALAAMTRQSFDIVLIDLQVPVMDAFEVTARIRGLEHYSGERVPIIAFTAAQEDRERCLIAGLDDCVVKPIRNEELAAVIERWAGMRREDRKPVLNVALLESQTHGDKDLEREIARLFRAESPRLMQRLGDALDSGDTTAIRQAAHRIKGSLSTLGAVRAAETAARIESAGMRDEPNRAALLEPVIKKQLHELDFALAQLLESEGTETQVQHSSRSDGSESDP